MDDTFFVPMGIVNAGIILIQRKFCVQGFISNNPYVIQLNAMGDFVDKLHAFLL